MKTRDEERRELIELFRSIPTTEMLDKFLDWHRACGHGERRWCYDITWDGKKWMWGRWKLAVGPEYKFCPECGAPRPEGQ